MVLCVSAEIQSQIDTQACCKIRCGFGCVCTNKSGQQGKTNSVKYKETVFDILENAKGNLANCTLPSTLSYEWIRCCLSNNSFAKILNF